ncbi:MAG: hypothetical protein LBE92_08915 [Chryseobacterium sp.]|jgi:hypothetical protein|uniref:hypothetical protein n=1 Tax=Chryseobacterium sp. TaxID=1871047 RepID=UPI002829B9CB|nr:hypothetical protein [Chryseobacterium sp.]MDR2236231.1 hypothetical protein [Chryseobacterium sp.]
MNKLLLIHGSPEEPFGSAENFALPAFLSEKSNQKVNLRITNTLPYPINRKGKLIGTS